ncbi:MAG: hypothetical protein ABIK92_11930 [Pseudomonadota bacterium]
MKILRKLKNKIKPNLFTTILAGILMGSFMNSAAYLKSFLGSNSISEIACIVVVFGCISISYYLLVPYDKKLLENINDHMNNRISFQNIVILFKLHLKMIRIILTVGFSLVLTLAVYHAFKNI